ncbi:hypothetical protein ACWC0D_27750, partial [Streptomyces sp. NPDC001719]
KQKHHHTHQHIFRLFCSTGFTDLVRRVAGEPLQSRVRRRAADEVLVTTASHDREALFASYRRLARLAGLPAAASQGLGGGLDQVAHRL